MAPPKSKSKELGRNGIGDEDGPYEPLDPRYAVTSAVRTLRLLNFVAEQGRPLSLGDMATGLDWKKPMVYRFVRTLLAHGALRHAAPDGYALGPVMVKLGQAALSALAPTEIALPYMQELAKRHSLSSVNLGTLDRDSVLYVARIEGSELLSIRVEVGSRLPAYATALGQVLLADLGDEEVKALFGSRFKKHGPNTITSWPQMKKRLDLVRRVGYSTTNGHIAAAIGAVAAPIRDHSGRAVAALNASLPTDGDIPAEIVEDVVATAGHISTELGVSVATLASTK